MSQLNEYNISYKGLVEGEHEYNYVLRDAFFEVYENEDIHGANLDLNVLLNKKSTHIEIVFDIKGTVTLKCDRCLEVFDDELNQCQTIYIKFGEEYAEEDENLYVLPEADNDINLATFINELVVVALPMRKVHPDDEDENPTCKNNMLDYINNISNEGSVVDPRWNELNKLKDGAS